jgi:hypothetical protein
MFVSKHRLAPGSITILKAVLFSCSRISYNQASYQGVAVEMESSDCQFGFDSIPVSTFR